MMRRKILCGHEYTNISDLDKCYGEYFHVADIDLMCESMCFCKGQYVYMLGNNSM